MNYFKSKVKELCAIDLRSLAIFRIGISLILIWDICSRLFDLKAHYSDEGVLPRNVLIKNLLSSWDYSLHLLNGTWQIQLALFLLALIFAILLLIGYKTKLANLISWILLVSLHTRNPLVLQGGDVVLRVLLFWSLFLPMGAYFSLDRSLANIKEKRTQISTVASLGLLLQICFIYWFTVLLKTDESWRISGTAVWYALSIEQYSTAFGIYLLNFPEVLKFLTFVTFYFEAFAPFLAFSPIWTGPLRFITFVLFALFHMVGLHLAMELAHFTFVCTIAWIVFIPKWFWDKVFVSKEKDLNEIYQASVSSNVLATLLIGYVFIWNINTLNLKSFKLTETAQAPGLILGIGQYWNMFAPFPLKEDGWYVMPALLQDGTTIDLYTSKDISYEKPKLLSTTYKNDRWRSYLMNIFLDEQGPLFFVYYANYIAQEWNDTHPFEKQVLSFDIEYMHVTNQYDVPKAKHQKILLWHHICPSCN